MILFTITKKIKTLKLRTIMTNKKQSITIQFIKGIDEKVHPEIRLNRNRDKKSGQAIYKFKNPTSISKKDFKNVERMYLIDKEGEISTRRINIYVLDNNLLEIESIYSWNSDMDFNRFMRFAKRYAKSNNLTSAES